MLEGNGLGPRDGKKESYRETLMGTLGYILRVTYVEGDGQIGNWVGMFTVGTELSNWLIR